MPSWWPWSTTTRPSITSEQGFTSTTASALRATLQDALRATTVTVNGIVVTSPATPTTPGVLPSARTPDAPSAPNAPSTDAVDDPTAPLRAQLLRYELYANSGRFQSRVRDIPRTIDMKAYAQPHTFKWLVMPLASVQITAPGGATLASGWTGLGMLDNLKRTVTTPNGTLDVALVPLHHEEARTLEEKFTDLVIVDDGEMFQTASPRSVLFGTKPELLPKLAKGIERSSVKMHLSDETYARLGGHDGSRVLDKNDCLMASVFSDVVRKLVAPITDKNGCRVEVLGEDVTICATIGNGDDAVELGAIVRTLPEKPAVPGFALFSPTRERLPHAKDLPGPLRARVDKGEERVLAADAITILRDKNPGLSKEDAFVRLFGEPLLDVVFGLYAQGATLELHPQNFLLRFDERTGDVDKVVVRDLHGLNYSKAWREKLGLPDICGVDALRARYPDITEADLDGWFKRPDPNTGVPTLRDRYKAPDMFGRNFDVYISVFFYQTLVALEECGVMTRAETDRAIIKMRDAVEAAANKRGFDLNGLDASPYQTMGDDMRVVFDNGIRGRALFRRPTDPAKRAAFIAKHEAPLLRIASSTRDGEGG